jgi:WD40 repeat protein
VRAFWVADGTQLWARTEADENPDGERVALALVGFTDEDRALVSSAPRAVRAWNTRTGKEVYRLTAPDGVATVGPGGKVLASAEYGEIALFDLGTGREWKRVVLDAAEKVARQRIGPELVAWSGDGLTLITTLPGDHVCVLDPVTGEERNRFPVSGGTVNESVKVAWSAGGHSVLALALSPDGKRLLASAVGGAHVALWDVRTGKQLARLGTGLSVNSVAFGPDGKSAFTFSGTGIGYRWDVEQVLTK